MRLGILAFGLGITLTVGCAPAPSDNDTNPRSKEAAMAEASAKSTGPSTTVCDVPYDADGNGTNESTLIGICRDVDGDGDAATPADPDDVFADGQCVCADAVLEGTVQVEGAGTDCNDNNPAVNPSATETCNEIDDNCDGSIDETGSSSTFYADGDGDTFGNFAISSTACTTPSGYVTDATDCDDTTAAVNPAATEVCDAADVDEDCDGDVDDADGSVMGQSTWYLDGDGDSFGSAATSATACDQPSGYVVSSTDCDDGDEDVNPAEVEVCDGLDNDCNDLVDDGLTFGDPVYPDADADGYGDKASSGSSQCDGAGMFESFDNTDCLDTNAAVNPDAVEVSLNGMDDDCDGLANATDTVEFSVPVVAEMAGNTWRLMVRDGTTDWDGSSTSSWSGATGAAMGTDTLLFTTTVTDGNTEFLNGDFDTDGDGGFGDAWGFMIGFTFVDTAGVTANGYPVTFVSTCWDSTFTCSTGGMDGRWIVDLL